MKQENDLEKLRYLKGNPDHILPSLLIIRELLSERYDRDKVQTQLAQKILGTNNQIRTDNFIWSRIRQPLTNLNLIREDKKSFTLTAFSRTLIGKIRYEDYDFKNKRLYDDKLFLDYKNRLGKVIIEMDKKSNKIFNILSRLATETNDRVSIEDLRVELQKLGINASEETSGTRLPEILRYYDFSGLLVYKKGMILLNEQKYNAVEGLKLIRENGEISDNEFFSSLIKTYDALLKDSKKPYASEFSPPYIPIIPYIEYLVTYELCISDETFREKLLNLPTSYNGASVLLAPSRQPVPAQNTIIKNSSVYYYLTIFREGG